MDCDKDHTNILGIVDGDNGLYVTARNKIEASKFNSRLCVQYKSTDKMLNANIAHRQQRIANIHEYAKQYIPECDYIWLIEDDGEFKTDALSRLQRVYQVYPFAGIVGGVQLGRHGIASIGAYKLDDIYSPSFIGSVELGQGIEAVDAIGFYCALTKKKLYMKHEFKPFENILGPDTNYGIELRRQGLSNYINYDIPVVHMHKDTKIVPRKENVHKVSFVKIETRWRQRSIIE